MNFVDDIFEEFACAFIGRVKGADEIAEKRKLNRKRLDFSVDSLHVVDDYLLVLHERHDQGKLDAKGDQLAVLRGGAYLGEVIRRNSDEQWHWVDYDEYMPSHPELRVTMTQKTVATCAFLRAADDSMIMPPNRINRLLEDGAHMSTHAFAAQLGRLR